VSQLPLSRRLRAVATRPAAALSLSFAATVASSGAVAVAVHRFEALARKGWQGVIVRTAPVPAVVVVARSRSRRGRSQLGALRQGRARVVRGHLHSLTWRNSTSRAACCRAARGRARVAPEKWPNTPTRPPGRWNRPSSG